MSLSDRAVEQLRAMVDRPEIPDGRYVVHEEIGRGGMGIVYRAVDPILEREVAIKVLHHGPSSEEHSARLVREARILARLDHPGIVPIHDSGVLVDGRVFYVMRLIRATRLDTHLMGDASRGELLRMALRLCETIAFAHECGVVHRDLKPSNVMVGAYGDVLVLDWGVAKELAGVEQSASDSARENTTAEVRDNPPAAVVRDDSKAIAAFAHTRDGTVVGTPGYMAPEQASGNASTVDARADVFSLGVILGELLDASDEPVSKPLHAIVARATAPRARDRYANASELAADLRSWLDGASVSAYRETAVERVGRFYRRHQVATLLIASYIVVRIAIMVLGR